MPQNPISRFVSKYQDTIKSPATQAAVLAGVGVPAMYLLRRPMQRLIRHVGMDPRVNAALGTNKKDMDQALTQMQNNWVGKHGLPLFLGLAPAAASLVMNYTPGQSYGGLGSWGVKKNSALMTKVASLWETQGYQTQLDLSTTVNPNTVAGMIQNNPYLQNSPYERALGTSIVTGAKRTGSQTTLGNIYDSALNKFDHKLSFEGVTNKAVKSLVQGSLAGMFTDVVGSVVGLPDPVRGQVANTVGFASALNAILN